jgi:hypothetical protein
MSRNFLFISVAALLAASDATAQSAKDYNTSQMTHEGSALRGFHGAAVPIRRSFRSDSEARAILGKVLAAAGLAGMEDRIFLRASAQADNAVATIENGQRVVFYNVDFMQRLRKETNDYWSMIAILAHEVGHHVRLHTSIPGRDHEFELEADYQAGFILRRMGASRDQAIAAYRTFPEAETPSHPGRAERVQSVTLGWIDGGAEHRPSGVGGSGPVQNPGTQHSSPPPRSELIEAQRTQSASQKTAAMVQQPPDTRRQGSGSPAGLNAAQTADLVRLLDTAQQQLDHHLIIGLSSRNIRSAVPKEYRANGIFWHPVGARRTRTQLPLGERAQVIVEYEKIVSEILAQGGSRAEMMTAIEQAKRAR